MATEHEIDRMVVRLVGNQEDYQKMLKDVEKQTEKSASWAEEQGSKISEAFNKAFKTAQGMLSSIGSGMQKTGAASIAASTAITAPLGKAAMDFSEYGKSISDMIRQSEQAAKRAADLQKSVVGNTEAFKELGRVIKLSEEEAATFKMMSERTGVSLETLTKTIKVGSAEYEKWRKEAEKFGLVLGKDQVQAANALAESWHRVKQALSGMWTQVGSVIAEGLTDWIKILEGLIRGAADWVKKNKEIIETLSKIAMYTTIVGGALVAVGTALSTIATFLGPITAMVVAGAAAWLAWNTESGKFLTGQGAELWGQYEESIKSAYNTVMDYGKRIMDFTSKVVGGVFDAIKAGNLELAVEILWGGVKVAWMKALDEINKLTGERFGAIFENLAAGNWKASVEALWVEIQIAWLNGTSLVNQAWDKVEEGFAITVNELHKLWNNFMEFFEGGIRSLLIGLGDLLNWITQNAGKIGAMISIGALIKGKGVAEATAMGVAAGVAANQLGSMGADMVASLPIPEVRNAAELNRGLDQQLSQGRTDRQDKALEREREVRQQIIDLEYRRTQLESQGRTDAEARLAVEKEQLETNLQQAEAERKTAEEEAANAVKTAEYAEEQRRLQERALQLEQQRAGLTEKYDPVAKYMRQMRELNALFDESQRSSKVYKEALTDIMEELEDASMKVEVRFDILGMDAVKRGTQEYQQLIANSIETTERQKALAASKAEAERRQGEIDAAGLTEEEMAQISSTGMIAEGGAVNTEEKQLSFLDRIAQAIEKVADRPQIVFEALGAI